MPPRTPFSARGARCALLAVLALGAGRLRAGVGADLPWTTYPASAMRTSGTVLGPRYDPNTVEDESTGQRCVKLTAPGMFAEFTAAAPANAIVVRFSLPDSPMGGGTSTQLELLINGRKARTLALSSKLCWLYGNYPFSNDPQEGKPRNFYDELRVQGLGIRKGDTLRLQWPGAGADYCILDLADLEEVPPALPPPTHALCVLGFGADPSGARDATEALRRCIAEARRQGRVVWMPPGDYRIAGEILVPSAVTIQGAGMWHTNLVGDEAVYRQAARRVRLKLAGNGIHLADFAIMGKLDYRNDSEPNDGIIGAGCADSSISRIWIEHTKVGIWIYNGVRLTIEGCRFRDTIADGVNLCVGTSGNVIEECAARGTGDDCFALWPAASDQGFVGKEPPSGHNVIRHCTGQLPFLANGAAVYGGVDNRVEDCRFTDLGTGCGILISSTFPTSDPALGIDNNFTGTTVVKDCELLRCGGYDHDWAWRGSMQICMDRRSIAGLAITGLTIRDSISSGVTVVGPGSAKGEGTLSDARLDRVTVSGSGLSGSPHHDLWIRKDALGALKMIRTSLPDVQNDSGAFRLLQSNE